MFSASSVFCYFNSHNACCRNSYHSVPVVRTVLPFNWFECKFYNKKSYWNMLFKDYWITFACLFKLWQEFWLTCWLNYEYNSLNQSHICIIYYKPYRHWKILAGTYCTLSCQDGAANELVHLLCIHAMCTTCRVWNLDFSFNTHQ